MRICKIEGCGIKHYGKGFCRKHYRRFFKHGNPNMVLCENVGTKKTIQEQLWNRVEIDSNDCWNFIGCKNRGYGRLGYKGKLIYAHRLAWILTNGEIPVDMCVLHRCDNPACIFPNHLFLGTYKDNMQDMISKNRQRYSFISGHPSFNTKLDQGQVKEIRGLYDSGDISQYKLAKLYGVTKSCIQKIISKNSWRNI